MSRRLRFIISILAASLVAIALQRYGSPVWLPAGVRASEELTVSEVVSEIKESGNVLDDSELSGVESLTLLALKEERQLEVWGHEGAGRMRLLRKYPFTAYSGRLGPKLEEGDLQIPEGIYRIEYLNPNSSYHLSMKLDYPNAFDRERGKEDERERLGGDIFIHGRAVTIGCIPIGDAAIEELFALVADMGIEQVEAVLLPWDFRTREDSPEIEGIEWEETLYEQLRERAAEIPVTEEEEPEE